VPRFRLGGHPLFVYYHSRLADVEKRGDAFVGKFEGGYAGAISEIRKETETATSDIRRTSSLSRSSPPPERP